MKRSEYNRVANFPHTRQDTHVAAGKDPPVSYNIKNNLAYGQCF